jgi:ABC-type phosphate transport system substrate-binding protein
MRRIMLGLFIVLSWATWSVFPEVLIITNPDTQPSALKKKEVQDIFTGKRTRWNGSGKIIIATLEDSKVHREFVRQFVHKTPSQFKNYWRQKVFTGEGLIPRTFKDEDSLIEFVASTKGAVGYISSPDGKPTNIPVKVIAIEDSKGERQ